MKRAHAKLRTLATVAGTVVFTSVLLGTVHVLHADAVTFTSGETLSSSKMNNAFAQLSNRLDALEKANADRDAVPEVPSGSILAFGGGAAPAGWALCDGTSLSRVDEPSLFAAIGTGWGAADDTHFNVPDLRGRFLRGVDGTAGNDPEAAGRTAMNPGGNTGDKVGSVQPDQFGTHTHQVSPFGAAVVNVNAGNNAPIAVAVPPIVLTTTAAGGAETRPRNAAVTYIIKK